MSTSITRPRTEAKPRTERPKVYKVILLNDDYTPREFVVGVLARGLPHDRRPGARRDADRPQKGAASSPSSPARSPRPRPPRPSTWRQREGYPLMFTTEPED